MFNNFLLHIFVHTLTLFPGGHCRDRWHQQTLRPAGPHRGIWPHSRRKRKTWATLATILCLVFSYSLDNIWFLDGLWSPFSFNASIDIVGFKSTILVFWGGFHFFLSVPFFIFVCLLWDLLNILWFYFILALVFLAIHLLFIILRWFLEFTIYMFNFSQTAFN